MAAECVLIVAAAHHLRDLPEADHKYVCVERNQGIVDFRLPLTDDNPYSERQILMVPVGALCLPEHVDAPKRAVFALHITKSTPDNRNNLRVYPRGDAYSRLIDPNGVVGPGQRTLMFLTFPPH